MAAFVLPLLQIAPFVVLGGLGLGIGLEVGLKKHHDKRGAFEEVEGLMGPAAMMDALTANHTARPWTMCIDKNGVER